MVQAGVALSSGRAATSRDRREEIHMMRNHEKTYVCQICQQQKPARESLHGDLIHGPVIEMIRRTHPGWSSHDVICLSCLNRFRADDVEQVVEAEKGELSSLEAEVVRSLKEYELGLTPRGRSRGS
jgi:hypothetical protein